MCAIFSHTFDLLALIMLDTEIYRLLGCAENSIQSTEGLIFQEQGMCQGAFLEASFSIPSRML